MQLRRKGLISASLERGNQTQVAALCVAVASLSLVARTALGQVPGTNTMQSPSQTACSAPNASSYLAPHAAWAVSPGAAVAEVFIGAGLRILFHHNDSRCITSAAALGPTRPGISALPNLIAQSQPKRFRRTLLLFRKHELSKNRSPRSVTEVAPSTHSMN